VGSISRQATTAVRGRLALLIALASVSGLAVSPAAASAAAAGFGRLSGSGGCLVGPDLASSEQGTSGCGVGKGLVGPGAVAVSPDGANVYVASGTVGATVAASFGSLAILKRDPATGAVTEVSCLSSDGTDGRDGASGACTATPSLLGADGVTVSPDGLAVFVASSYSGSVVAFARNPADGSLTRLGCFQSRPVGGTACPYANVFTGSGALVASADSRSLYVASPAVGSVSTLTAAVAPAAPAPAPTAGEGTPASAPEPTAASIFSAPHTQPLANPCIAANGFDGSCSVGVAVLGLDSIALSPDGKNLYGAAPGSNAVDVFTPDSAGVLTETSCLKANPPPGLCHASRLMSAPTLLAISPDGRNVYGADSANGSSKVDVFTRDPASGALTEASCVDFLAPPKPPESKEEQEEEQHEQSEPGPPDPCTSVPGLRGVAALAVSGDGSAVYAIGSDSAVIFSRDAATGKLTEASCADSEDSRCTSMASLSGVDGAAVSPDGREVYVSAKDAGTLAVFGLGAAVGSGQASASAAGVARVPVVCPRGLRRWCVGRVRLVRAVTSGSAHGRRRAHISRTGAGDSAVFALRPGTHRTIPVRLSAQFVSLLRAHGRLRLLAVVLARPSAGGSGYGRRVTLRLHR
jgi:DNA-binding beta-propeller fold protein YncE